MLKKVYIFLGATVADAAARPLHWVYNEKKLKSYIKNKKNIAFFKINKNRIYFDLPNYVKKQVKLNKIKNIDLINVDTFNIKNNFFSARRSLKLNHNDYGRNISTIMIN